MSKNKRAAAALRIPERRVHIVIETAQDQDAGAARIVYLLPKGRGGQTDSLPVKFAHKKRTVPMPEMTINEIG